MSINIDGLEKQIFVEPNLSSYLHSTPAAIAKLLQFDQCPAWKIGLSNDQMLARIENGLAMRDFSALYPIVEGYRDQLDQCDNRNRLWNETIYPHLKSEAEYIGITLDEKLETVLAWCHPANSSNQLHPRALQFIHHHWPAMHEKINEKQEKVISAYCF